jgi:hypothetical protein
MNYLPSWHMANYRDALVGGSIGAALAAILIILLIVLVALYVYFALAWYTIAKKMKYRRPWLAWIPFANIAMWLQLGGFHWAWVFLMIIPVIGWIAIGVLFIISSWRVFEKLRYPYGVVIGIVAWRKKR